VCGEAVPPSGGPRFDGGVLDGFAVSDCRSYAAVTALAAVSGLRSLGGVSVDVAGPVFDN